MHEIVIIIAKYFIVIPVAVAAYVFWKLDKKARVDMLVLLAASAIVTAALMKLAATLHQDPRPFVRDGVHPYFAHGNDNGFPSDHTTFSALVAFVVYVFSRKLGIALAVVALAIGTSRVIAGVHHGQDIIAGFIIAAAGVSLSLLAVRAVAKWRKRAE